MRGRGEFVVFFGFLVFVFFFFVFGVVGRGE